MHKMVRFASGKDYSELKNIALSDKEIIIYGAGVNGELFCRYLECFNKNVVYFCDRFAEIREYEVLGKLVHSPEYLFNNIHDEYIVVSPDNHVSLIDYLMRGGIKENHILVPFAEKRLDIISPVYNDEYCSEFNEYNGQTPAATVFTIVYNTPAELLKRTVESVLNQTERSFRYLIIDNGSNDGSNDLLQRYAYLDKRIKLITLDRNVPWTSAELLGTLKQNIEGEYVCMVDSDDYYMEGFLQKVMTIVNIEHPDIVQVNSLTYSEDEERYSYFNHTLGEDKLLEEGNIISYLLQRILMVSFWGKLYSSKLFEALIDHMLKYDDKERDNIFRLDISWVTFEAVNAKKVYLCDDVLHVRTWRSGSSETSTGSLRHWLNSMTWSFDYIERTGVSDKEVDVFADCALTWLFELNRKGLKLPDFDSALLDNKHVNDYLSRPVCDSLKD